MAANLTTKLGQLVDVLTPDTTNTRIGVANASPTRTLDVTGTFGASGASTLGGALTYGGVTLSNAVTGTGNMVLSASPTLTGTLTGAAANFSGAIGANGTIVCANNSPLYFKQSGGTTNEILNLYSDNNLYFSSPNAIIIRPSGGGEAARWTSTGLGLGMTPSNILDITQNQNAASVIKLLNNSAGANAQALVQLSDGTNNAYMAFFGTGGAGTGPNNPGSFSIQTQATGGMNIATTAAYPIKFHINSAEVARFGTGGNLTFSAVSGSLGGDISIGLYSNNYLYINGSPSGGLVLDGDGTNRAQAVIVEGGSSAAVRFNTASTERARFDSSGSLLVGTTSSASGAHYITKGGSAGTLQLRIYDGSSGNFYAVNQGLFSSAVCGFTMGRDSTTQRSINAGGTINASGADYAEYMTKADNCGVITKGAIAGVDASGKLTDKFSDAHSFVVKSTDPSYVGGDAWGSQEALGIKNPDKGDHDYAEKKASLVAALEAARQTVDRIAFSGQVPVNVTGATVGDYIVPVAGPDGGIAGEAVTNPTFDQYRAAVGRVWKILEDGRAFVSVKVS
jgi:hypothetical protein